MPNNFVQPKINTRKLVIIGSSGHAISVANVALSAGYEIAYFVDKSNLNSTVVGINVVGSISELGDFNEYNFSIAIGDNSTRERIFKELTQEFGSLHFPSIFHASANISFFSQVGDGTIAMPGSVIGPNSVVGKFCLLNTHSSIDHDCIMSDFSSLAPRATTGGNVKIGHRSAICIGATVKHGLSVGDDSVLGANSYLNFNLPSNKTSWGSPAKIIKERHPSDKYL